MRTDSRLSRMLHVLLHMARESEPLTSERIAEMLGTNAAVVRRTMAGLREAGMVSSERGHNGGWRLSCDLKKITLLDVHRAVGGPKLFAIGADHDNPDCLVEKVVNDAVASALEQAEALLVARLSAISLADLSREFDQQFDAASKNKARRGHRHS